MLPLLSTVVPEPSLLDLGGLLVQAITSKHYSLLGSVLVLGLVFLARWGGTRLHPVFATPRAGALLVAVGGTATLIIAALVAGEPFTLALLMDSFLTAAGASGIRSIVKNAIQKPLLPPVTDSKSVCTPIEIANGTCKP